MKFSLYLKVQAYSDKNHKTTAYLKPTENVSILIFLVSINCDALVPLGNGTTEGVLSSASMKG